MTIKDLVNKSKKSSSNIWNAYKKHFHNKWYSLIVYGVFFVLMILMMILLNIHFINGGKHTMKQLSGTLDHWNSSTWSKTIGLSGDDFKAIKRGWYNVFATIIAGIAMTLAAIATQSLTRNPIAEGSTLGLVQGAIFGVIFALSLGMSSLIFRYFWMTFFGIAAALLLLLFIVFSKRKSNGMQKIILAGLAIGIIFKTLTFIFKVGNTNLNSVAYSYVLGGAESISGETVAMSIDSLVKSLTISGSLVSAGLILCVFNIKGMNLLEIGDERAKNLGSNIVITRVLNILIILLVIPASVILVGNMAFLGLFAVHAARWMTRSRNYKKVIPFSLAIGMMFSNMGLQLTEHIPQVNSGIWMTFIGAPYLIYIGVKGLK